MARARWCAVAANDAWPAPTQARLGSWVLRAADSWTGRGNSALAVGTRAD